MDERMDVKAAGCTFKLSKITTALSQLCGVARKISTFAYLD